MSVAGKGKEVKKTYVRNPKIVVERTAEGNAKFSAIKATKKELKLLNSLVAHVRNMVEGVQEDYYYELEICSVHFPMVVKTEGNRLRIKNFLGEKIDRMANIIPGVKVDVKGTKIEVRSPNIELAGQTAANFEIATKIRNRDRRVFQDGIFITKKPGRKA
jgi:large subunit ribosomal protein L6